MSTQQDKEKVFSLRAVSVDSYMAKPVENLDVTFSEFKKSKVTQVPVLRVFGSTPAGQTTCMHIHRIFPYLLVPYHGPDCESADWNEVEAHLRQLASSLDIAINSTSNFKKSKREHVYNIILVRAKSYYGYHEEDEIFMKIYLYSPANLKRASEALQSGGVMQQVFQPHEAHVPYILQVFMDYNLHGMNLIHASSCYFRSPLGKPKSAPVLPQIHSNVVSNKEEGRTTDTALLSSSQVQNFNWAAYKEQREASVSIEEENHTSSPSVASTQFKNCSHACADALSRTLGNTQPGNLNEQSDLNSSCPLHIVWSQSTIPKSAFLPPEVERESVCELEVDVLGGDILNRKDLESASGGNPGIASIWEDEKVRRRERMESSQIALDKSQDPRSGVNVTEKEDKYIYDLNVALHQYYDDNADITQLEDSVRYESMKPSSSPTSVDEVPASFHFSQDSDPEFTKMMGEMDWAGPGSQHNLSHIETQHSASLGVNDQISDDDNDENRNAENVLSHESYVMTQPWESGIEDFLFDVEDDDVIIDDVIPQLDGASDEQKEPVKKRLGTSRRHTYHHTTPPTITTLETDKNQNCSKPMTSTSGVQADVSENFQNSRRLSSSDPELAKKSKKTVDDAVILLPRAKTKFLRQNSVPLDKNPSRDINSNMFSTFQALLNGINPKIKLPVPLSSTPSKKTLKTSKNLTPIKTLKTTYNAPEKVTEKAAIVHPVLKPRQKIPPIPQPVLIPDVEGASVTFSQQGAAVASWGEDESANIEKNDDSAEESSHRVSLRPRRAKQISKCSYMNDPQYETDFGSDWEDFAFDTNTFDPEEPSASWRSRSKGSAPNIESKVEVGRKKSLRKRTNKQKRRRSKQEKDKVIIKWIITHRFKGTQKMMVKLWKIGNTKRVRLTPELLKIYDLYSPKRPVGNSAEHCHQVFKKPPSIPKKLSSKVPKGKRTKENVVTLFHPLDTRKPLPVATNVPGQLNSDSLSLSKIENAPENYGKEKKSTESEISAVAALDVKSSNTGSDLVTQEIKETKIEDNFNYASLEKEENYEIIGKTLEKCDSVPQVTSSVKKRSLKMKPKKKTNVLPVANRTLTPVNQTLAVPSSVIQTGTVDSPVNQTSAAASPVNQTTIVESPVNQVKAVRPLVNQATSVTSPVNQTLAVKSPVNQTGSGDSLVNQTTAVDSPVNQTTTVESPVNQTLAFKSSINQTAVVVSCVNQTAAVVSPVNQNSGSISPVNQYFEPILLVDQNLEATPSDDNNLALVPPVNQNLKPILSVKQNLDPNSTINKNSESISTVNQNLGSISPVNQNSGFNLSVNQNLGSISSFNQNSGSDLSVNQNLESISSVHQNLGHTLTANQNLGHLSPVNQTTSSHNMTCVTSVRESRLDNSNVSIPNQEIKVEQQAKDVSFSVNQHEPVNQPTPTVNQNINSVVIESTPNQEKNTEKTFFETNKRNSQSSKIKVELKLIDSETILKTVEQVDVNFGPALVKNDTEINTELDPSTTDSVDTSFNKQDLDTTLNESLNSTVDISVDVDKIADLTMESKKTTPPSDQVSLAKKYLPTRRVTRRSVKVRMTSLQKVDWMFTDKTDDSKDLNLVHNVLEKLAFEPPGIHTQHSREISPPRAWSPMVHQTNNIPVTNLQPLQADDHILDITESMWKEMDDMISMKPPYRNHSDEDNLLSHLDALLEDDELTSHSEALSSQVVDQMELDTELIDALSATNDVTTPADMSPVTSIGATITHNSYSNQPKPFHPLPTINEMGVDPLRLKLTPGQPVTPTPPLMYPMPASITSTSRAVPNKRTLEEQLHKQMQAVYLQQQMLDQNNFRQQKVPQNNDYWLNKCNPERSMAKNLSFDHKDLLGEVCQQVFSDSRLSLPPAQEASYDIRVSAHVSQNPPSLEFVASQPFPMENQANNFIYPPQTFKKPSQPNTCKTASACMPQDQETMIQLQPPVPANPVQVLHTHVHHHHHIHSLKTDADTTMPMSPPIKTNFFGKSELTSPPEWPQSAVKSDVRGFNAEQSNVEVPVSKPTSTVPKTRKASSFSIMMKPTCQNGDEKYWLQVQMQHGIPWNQTKAPKPTKKKTKRKDPTPKSNLKTKLIKDAKKMIPLCSDPEHKSKKAKTPYGMMKSKSGNKESNILFPAPKMRPEMTVPSDTPTISLSNVEKKKDVGNEFDISQEMFPSSTTNVSPKETKPEPLVKTPVGDKEKSRKKKSRPKKDVKLTDQVPDGYCSKFTTVPLVTAQQFQKVKTTGEKFWAKLPKINENQELILNYETGNWDIVNRKRNFEKDKISQAVDSVKLAVQPSHTLCTVTDSSVMNNILPGSTQSIISSSFPTTKPSVTNSCQKRSLSKFKFAESGISTPKVPKRGEYFVANVDFASSAPKLKLTLKKEPNSADNQAEGLNKVHCTGNSKPLVTEPLEDKISIPQMKRKGKPVCFEAMMKGSLPKRPKHSRKKVVKKKKPKPTLVLDSSLEFEPENTEITQQNPVKVAFDRQMHLESVRTLCRSRSLHGPIHLRSGVIGLSEKHVEDALSVLRLEAGVEDEGASYQEQKSSIHGISCFTDFLGAVKQALVSAPKSGDNPSSSGRVSLKTDVDATERNPGTSEELLEDQNDKSLDTKAQKPKTDLKSEENCSVFTAVPSPPSQEDVQNFLTGSGLEQGGSKEPFYSNPRDVQTSSFRLGAGLPTYVKRPKVQASLKDMKDFESTLPPECSLMHWRVVLAAHKVFTTGNRLAPDRTSDLMDVVTNMGCDLNAEKALVRPHEVTVITPALPPPSQAEVGAWLEEKKREKQEKDEKKATNNKATVQTDTKALETEKKKSGPAETEVLGSSVLVPCIIKEKYETTPILKRVKSEEDRKTRRRVSFDFTKSERSEMIPTSSPLVESMDLISTPQSEASDESASSAFPPNQATKIVEESSDETEDFSPLMVSSSSDISFSFSTPTEKESKSIASLLGSKDEDEEYESLTPLLSGQFQQVDVEKSVDNTVVVEKKPSTPVAQPQTFTRLESTPNTGKKTNPPLRKLLYTPIPKEKTVITQETPKIYSILQSTQPMQDFPSVSKQPASQKRRVSLSFKDTPADSEIIGPSLSDTYGFRAKQEHLGDAKALHEVQHVTLLSIELHCKTRIDLRPDPEMDEIRALFYGVQTDSSPEIITGAIIVDEKKSNRNVLHRSGVTCLNAVYVASENLLFEELASIVLLHDPDMLLGYEIQMLSWGYLFARAAHLGVDLCRGISRVPGDKTKSKMDAEADAYGADNMSEIHVVGRVMLNIWRLMRTELALCDYKFESVAFHLLHERHPVYSFQTLTAWFDHSMMLASRAGISSNRGDVMRHRVLDYYMCRVIGNLKLMSQQDMVGRTSELARLFGIQFYDVLTRGSQFRVESMMLRIVHSQNYVAVSPNQMQRAYMKAPECIALVMEPESRFYHEPVVVVDFQSLYPSIIIAYNYCYSTCLGRVQHLGSHNNFPFGCTSLKVPPRTLHKLLKRDGVTVAPNAVAYVKSFIRKGILPTMLEEILETRIMVKTSIKKCDDSATKRMLDHRQLGLKLIANVTYGYTSANFSGRMPCVEIADSIVHKARETLERSIRLVNSNHTRWGGRVVYGDTDSMFVALRPSTSKQRAFEIGREIVKEITNANPRPVKLKLEKIYQPCILQTKKRYVGYAYESEDQIEPIFDAKGIETVRRDGCPAVSKILEKSIHTLFKTRDVSKVKSYVEQQCSKLLDGRSTVKDCTIAKEYRGAKYYKPGAVVPALVLTRKMMAVDKRSEPRVGERVPYIVVHGAPGTPLFQLVHPPQDLISDLGLRLNGAYYVTKMVLPALDRMMSLLGVDVFQWLRDMPRSGRLTTHRLQLDHKGECGSASTSRKATISQYFKSKHCLSCTKLSKRSLCSRCLSRDSITSVKLVMESRALERKKNLIDQICMNCTGAASPQLIKCICLDCPVLYKRFKLRMDESKAAHIRHTLTSHDLF